jgi:alpha-D-xyloside xylohydrolase
VVEGPRWVRERHGFDSVPLLARPGSVIALGARDDRPDYDYADGVSLRVHVLCDGARLAVSIPTPAGGDGVRFAIARAGREIRIERSGPPAPWRVLVVGRHTISASPGLVIPTPDGAVADLAMDIAFTVILLGNTQDENHECEMTR